MEKKDFFQEAPRLKNQFISDPWLRTYLQDTIAQELFEKWGPHLVEVGEDAAGKLLGWADEAEKNPPRHVPFDPWGKRVDRIEVTRAWRDLEAYSAQHGLIAEGYERKDGPWSRIYQMALLYLFHPSSAIFSCPLAMTDGAARAIEVYGNDFLKAHALKNLISRNPLHFWTSGQWMTERAGGSDVGQSETVARRTASGFSLFGDKWFTSATTSQMAMTLARIEGAESGSRGLSLFYVQLHDSQGDLQNITINRLKDKLGTKALPTAELSLRGTPALLLGGEGNGVKKISTLFNITRIYNAVCAIGYMRRALALALDYGGRRAVFGRLLKDQPLHLSTLAPLWNDTWGCSDFVFEIVRLLGRDECGEATPMESQLLRLYTPLAKLYTGKKVVAVTSEIIEGFGGAGYVEDTGLPQLLRNAQVLPIWEGTTNVLALDALRALRKDCPLEVWVEEQKKRIQEIVDPAASNHLKLHLEMILKAAAQLGSSEEEMAAHAREFAFAITELTITVLLTVKAQKNLSPYTQTAAAHWRRKLRGIEVRPAGQWEMDRSLLFSLS